MFDLKSGVRLRPFKESDLDDIVAMYNNIRLAPLMTDKATVVPMGEGLKEEFKDLVKNFCDFFAIVETLPTFQFKPRKPSPSTPSETTTTVPTPTPTPPTPKPGSFAGIIALMHKGLQGHQLTNLGIVLKEDYWNQGIGTEITEFILDFAFIHINIHKVILQVYESNPRAIKVYEKTGFVCEGVSRKARWINGRYENIVHMAVLKREWEERRQETGVELRGLMV